MNEQLTEIRDQQKASWDKFSGGWRKWDTHTMAFLQPAGDAIISMLSPKPHSTILDIAAGTGEPGLTLATMVPEGRVVITDLSDDMLNVAREKIADRGLGNVEVLPADVSELPFDDNTFDAISCRMGFMFFPDMDLAAREMARVLKPGGTVATSVWNVPDKNYWVTAIMDVIKQKMEIPPPAPGAPGMFRCAKDGIIADLFKSVGLTNVQQQLVDGSMSYDSIDTYWTMFNEVGAPIVAAMSEASDELREEIRREVYANIETRLPTNPLVIGTSAWVIGGQKAA